MKEVIDLRLPEQWACQHIGSLGRTMPPGGTRKVTLRRTDPMFDVIRDEIAASKAAGTAIGYSASTKRSYTKAELAAAEVFRLWAGIVFEPAGEECGTVYDEAPACPVCGAGRRQVSDLVLDLRKAPRRADLASTIAGEWVVSQRLAELIMAQSISGLELRPVHHRSRFDFDAIDLEAVASGRELLQRAEAAGVLHPEWHFHVWLNHPDQRALWQRVQEESVERSRIRQLLRPWRAPVWYQLVVTSPPIHTAAPTRFGIDAFDGDSEGRFRCPLGHVSGLNALSEIWIPRGEWDGSDIAQTKNMVGLRQGLLVPHPLTLVSPRFWRLLVHERMRGVSVEVAHLV